MDPVSAKTEGSCSTIMVWCTQLIIQSTWTLTLVSQNTLIMYLTILFESDYRIDLGSLLKLFLYGTLHD